MKLLNGNIKMMPTLALKFSCIHLMDFEKLLMKHTYLMKKI